MFDTHSKARAPKRELLRKMWADVREKPEPRTSMWVKLRKSQYWRRLAKCKNPKKSNQAQTFKLGEIPREDWVKLDLWVTHKADAPGTYVVAPGSLVTLFHTQPAEQAPQPVDKSSVLQTQDNLGVVALEDALVSVENMAGSASS